MARGDLDLQMVTEMAVRRIRAVSMVIKRLMYKNVRFCAGPP